ncbi:rhodanese-like domain-containing protein [Bacillus sp. SA1-12]|uniref:rhodanese-like domain-containing protein n=1 Tax=Bacillus sp. SA1-12 TaxID=1455638 RepID=UPI000AE7D65B
MDYVNYLFIVLFLFLMFKRILPTKGVNNISTTDLKAELNDKNKQFVDVRTPGEFRRNHIKGFKNIPLQNFEKKQR